VKRRKCAFWSLKDHDFRLSDHDFGFANVSGTKHHFLSVIEGFTIIFKQCL
jgi:hypothetical protein